MDSRESGLVLMKGDTNWFFPRGALARGNWDAVVDRGIPGWQYTGLRIADAPGIPFALPAAGVERMIIPLDARAIMVELAGDRLELEGRASVFDGPTDVAYLGAFTAATVIADGRFAVAEAIADKALPATVVRARDVAVELRGAGTSTRQVHNFGTPETAGAVDAQRLIVCEVVTPAGNWSSYPAHKHDQTTPGRESQLEEIYYFEAAAERDTPIEGSARPFGAFSAHGSPQRPLNLDVTVESGDIALIPHGYHGPAIAAPGYDLYYLNVMAGPGSHRQWLIADDPDQAWVRGAWKTQQPDPRLPYSRP